MLFPRTILVFLVVWHSHGLESGVVTVSSSAIHPVDDVLGTDSSELGSELSSQTQQNQQPLTRLECGIWLAPSTIPGSGLGMYAGRDFHAHEYLQEHLGDLVIPIIDIEEHASEYSTDDWKFLWDEYTWDAAPLHVDHEGFSSVNVASPGFGSAANSFLALVNVEEWSPVYDAANLHRSKDPGWDHSPRTAIARFRQKGIFKRVRNSLLATVSIGFYRGSILDLYRSTEN